MVQGGKVNKSGKQNKSKGREKQEAKKRKAAPAMTKEKLGDEAYKTINRKVKEHQKKIYKSIEQTIIDNAKKNRERFDII